jgi:hypothetical protein
MVLSSLSGPTSEQGAGALEIWKKLECQRLISWCVQELVKSNTKRGDSGRAVGRWGGGGELSVCAEHQSACAKQGRSLKTGECYNRSYSEATYFMWQTGHTVLIRGAVRLNFGYATVGETFRPLLEAKRDRTGYPNSSKWLLYITPLSNVLCLMRLYRCIPYAVIVMGSRAVRPFLYASVHPGFLCTLQIRPSPRTIQPKLMLRLPCPRTPLPNFAP